MSLADPGLALVLDPDRLSELVGREVRATYLRPKPGVSTVAALVHPDGLPWGWVRTLTGHAVAKAGKARTHVARAGLADLLGEAVLDGRDTLVQWGPVGTDPRLVRSLDGLDLTPANLLRHNPLRRLVLRQAGLVVRVTAGSHRDRLTELTADLAAAGVPVVRTVDPGSLPGGRHLSWWPWVDGHDASADVSSDAVLHQVGRAVGRLHQVDPAGVRHLAGRDWSDVRAAARSSVELLESVAPGAAGCARRVLDRLPVADPAPGMPGVVCHGDLSLDQALVRPDGSVLLTDLDRATVAPAWLDHASLAAADLVEGSERVIPLIEGYAASTGHRPTAPGAWVAAVLLARVAEPWRHQVAGWAGETVRRTLLAGRALAVDDVWAQPARELAVVP